MAVSESFIVNKFHSCSHGIPSQDVELALPDEPDVVRAKCVTSMSLPICDREELEHHHRSFNFSWSYGMKPLSIITFVLVQSEGESNRAIRGALRRLQMCFYSCHMHRRALCCKDGQVFGAHLHDDELQLYVSFWSEDILVRAFLYGNSPDI